MSPPLPSCISLLTWYRLRAPRKKIKTKVAFRGGNASREECQDFAKMYRSHIAPAESVSPLDGGRGGGKGGRGGVGVGSGGGGGGGAGRVFCFWCFCPGVAMQDLKALGVSEC